VNYRTELNRIEEEQLRMRKTLIERIDELERRLAEATQAILELDAAFRRSGLFDGHRALSLPPSVPDRQSAGAPSSIQA
jgi:hypothetical protein